MVINQASSSDNLSHTGDRQQPNLARWLTSVTNILSNVTTLEVSTTMVAEINEAVFIPWEAYQDIYALSRDDLQTAGINSDLSDRYLDLRRQLELKYALRAINPQCRLYNSSISEAIKQDLPILRQSDDSRWENLPSRLPSPYAPENTPESELLKQILTDVPLLNLLQQLAKGKASLDRHQLTTSETATTSITKPDIIYAQTVIQLEGKISNCYAQEILHHPDRTAILNLHQQGVVAAEKQWHGLLKFAIDIVQRQQKLR
ncbi:MAG TPA: hypothetical protein ACFCUY_14510 [Xenococcaceae cyanobacterium]